MKRVLIIIVFLFSLIGLINFLYYKKPLTNEPVSGRVQERLVAPLYNDKSLFLSAIKRANIKELFDGVTGITVPHHLLAINLVAKVFAEIKNNSYEQVILVSPDHFGACPENICYSINDFSTVFGTIIGSKDDKLFSNLSFVKQEDFFFKEHGVQALLPFIKYYFPNTKILIITFNYSTAKQQIDELLKTLKPLINNKTLIVQSTDFSHYLTAKQANVKDRETIKIIEDQDVNKIFDLKQPSNIDSKASQYFQSSIQKEIFNSRLTIVDHKNSQDYTNDLLSSTTSYIIQVYKNN